MGRALTAHAPQLAGPMPPEQAREVSETFASKEPELRSKAAGNFPVDAWSQDDDFFAAERGAAISWANDHGVRRQDVFAAIDRGLREWPEGSTVPRPKATVAPCKPRALE